MCLFVVVFFSAMHMSQNNILAKFLKYIYFFMYEEHVKNIFPLWITSWLNEVSSWSTKCNFIEKHCIKIIQNVSLHVPTAFWHHMTVNDRNTMFACTVLLRSIIPQAVKVHQLRWVSPYGVLNAQITLCQNFRQLNWLW